MSSTAVSSPSKDNNNVNNNDELSPPKPEPPAKKKRGADNQITKDDYDAANDDDDATDEEKEARLKQGFKRASEDVLKARKIYKVKRPTANGTSSAAATASTSTTTSTATTASSSDNGTAESSTSTKSSSNPFASTSLLTTTSSSSAAGSSPAKKVFGFGVAAANGSGFGSSGSGFAGFGSAAASSTSTSSAGSSSFGGVSSLTSGSKSSSGFGAFAEASGTKSLFGSGGGTSTSISFNLSSSSAAASTNKDSSSEDANPANLPDTVDLKTGEEGEVTVHSGRCKSFLWVPAALDTSAKDPEADETDNKAKTTLSVQSSTQFQTAESSSTTKAASEEVAGDYKWKELGIGPLKLLRSKSNPSYFRLVQRRESSKMGPATKVILNVPLWKESTCERDRQAPQYLRLKTLQDGTMCQYSLKFKENADAGSFHHYLMDHIPLARRCFGGSTPPVEEKKESSPASVSEE
jgi:hypothetical protein